jgi:hypothetical protein
MPGEETNRQRLADYIAGLKPGTQVAVLRELELAELRGEPLLPSFNVVADTLRRNIRQSGRPVERIGNPSRLFFLPLEPFLIDGMPDRAAAGTVARASLRPIWVWACRDLLPVQARAYVGLAKRALIAGDRASAMIAAKAFQDQFVAAARTALSVWPKRVRKRLENYMAPRTAVADLETMMRVLRQREALAGLAAALPPHIEVLSDPVAGHMGELLRPLLRLNEHVYVLALALLMRRFASPWQVVRLAAGDERARALAEDLVLGRIEAMAAALGNDTARRWHVAETADVIDQLRDALAAVWSELALTEETEGTVRWRRIAASVDRLEQLTAHRAILRPAHARRTA